MLVGFFGELGHGADPRACKKLPRLPVGDLMANHGKGKGKGKGQGQGQVLTLDSVR